MNTAGFTLGTVPTMNWANPSTDGETWILTFSGAGVTGNSIADGVSGRGHSFSRLSCAEISTRTASRGRGNLVSALPLNRASANKPCLNPRIE